ncbi:hypothetical protein GQS52_16130 [Streptomyces sp. SCUT-3]|uniref:hypothetical protein n=1 Tax=Streptomyces sp. SCUT-3 TaxID=2684469 RepID=UPI0015FAC3F2|nr:hypothetical protein [Streptomyces sp. SCUT-3]QMV23049.1 hypothetical protein GQS52_16130 [Streptomyces sp. SCUT-3]
MEVVVHRDRFGPTIHETGTTAEPGDELALPPAAFLTRYAHVIAVGDPGPGRGRPPGARAPVELRADVLPG